MIFPFYAVPFGAMFKATVNNVDDIASWYLTPDNTLHIVSYMVF